MPIGNLRAIANTQTKFINPNVAATLFISTGFTQNSAHEQVPSYDEAVVTAQVQPLSSGDVRQLDSLNVQGADKAVWLNGVALAIDRIKKLGGDLLVFPVGTLPEGNTWLIVASIEQWSSTWCKVAIALQDDEVTP